MKTLLLALSMAAIVAAAPQDYAADSKIVWEEQRARPLEEQLHWRYFSTHNVPDELSVEDVLAFWLPHLSQKAVLERQIPVRVGETKMYRIDLRGLGWTIKQWIKLNEENPYTSLGNPLIIRAEWLIRITADAEESSAYYDLLYGKTFLKGKWVTNTPANRNEFLKFWKINVDDAKGFEQAIIIDEGNSGVSLRTRTAVRRRSVTGAGWETFDSRDGVGFGDALAQIGGRLDYDASELITSIPKVLLKTGDRSNAQAYFLTDGKGKRINQADPRIVVDHTDPRIPIIRTPGSCVRCHNVGILNPPENAVRAVIEAGVELFAKGPNFAEGLERLYLGKMAPAVKEDQERFIRFVAAVTEKKPEEISSAYAKLLAWYNSPVTLEQAALEVGTTPDEVKLAIAHFFNLFQNDAAQLRKMARLATLAHQRRVPRKIWERQTYFETLAALALWRKKP